RLSVVALDHLDPIARKARTLLETNRERLHAFLDTRHDLDCVRPEFGTVVFPRLQEGGADALCRRLLERYDTSVVPGRFFGRPEHFRVGISVPTEMLAEGLERLAQALDSRPPSP